MLISKSMVDKVITIDKEANIFEAKQKMQEYNIRHIPVVDENNKLIGIVTDRDIRSVLPSILLNNINLEEEKKKISQFRIKDIMTKNPITLLPTHTIQDALLLIQKTKVGAFPVVDESGILTGIISVRDLLSAFISVLGIGEPGTLLGIAVEDKPGQMKKIVDAITEENISFGSIMVCKYGKKGERSVFPYLLTQNVATVKKKLEKMGYKILDPMEWYIEQLPQNK
ncbi:MAG: CBS domain-containing protein [Desulfobacterales bacterium]|nr:CBS domain-containing protein [Desulfobacterales bacterium]MBF0397182.1 CBS domain-containing protein [Desulfobacterales bacterium]